MSDAKKPPAVGVTDEEWDVLDALESAYRKWLWLGAGKKRDRYFRDAIHRCQDQVAAASLARQYPDRLQP